MIDSPTDSMAQPPSSPPGFVPPTSRRKGATLPGYRVGQVRYGVRLAPQNISDDSVRRSSEGDLSKPLRVRDKCRQYEALLWAASEEDMHKGCSRNTNQQTHDDSQDFEPDPARLTVSWESPALAKHLSTCPSLTPLSSPASPRPSCRKTFNTIPKPWLNKGSMPKYCCNGEEKYENNVNRNTLDNQPENNLNKVTQSTSSSTPDNVTRYRTETTIQVTTDTIFPISDYVKSLNRTIDTKNTSKNKLPDPRVKRKDDIEIKITPSEDETHNSNKLDFQKSLDHFKIGKASDNKRNIETNNNGHLVKSVVDKNNHINYKTDRYKSNKMDLNDQFTMNDLSTENRNLRKNNESLAKKDTMKLTNENKIINEFLSLNDSNEVYTHKKHNSGDKYNFEGKFSSIIPPTHDKCVSKEETEPLEFSSDRYDTRVKESLAINSKYMYNELGRSPSAPFSFISPLYPLDAQNTPCPPSSPSTPRSSTKFSLPTSCHPSTTEHTGSAPQGSVSPCASSSASLSNRFLQNNSSQSVEQKLNKFYTNDQLENSHTSPEQRLFTAGGSGDGDRGAVPSLSSAAPLPLPCGFRRAVLRKPEIPNNLSKRPYNNPQNEVSSVDTPIWSNNDLGIYDNNMRTNHVSSISDEDSLVESQGEKTAKENYGEANKPNENINCVNQILSTLNFSRFRLGDFSTNMGGGRKEGGRGTPPTRPPRSRHELEKLRKNTERLKTPSPDQRGRGDQSSTKENVKHYDDPMKGKTKSKSIDGNAKPPITKPPSVFRTSSAPLSANSPLCVIQPEIGSNINDIKDNVEGDSNGANKNQNTKSLRPPLPKIDTKNFQARDIPFRSASVSQVDLTGDGRGKSSPSLRLYPACKDYNRPNTLPRRKPGVANMGSDADEKKNTSLLTSASSFTDMSCNSNNEMFVDKLEIKSKSESELAMPITSNDKQNENEELVVSKISSCSHVEPKVSKDNSETNENKNSANNVITTVDKQMLMTEKIDNKSKVLFTLEGGCDNSLATDKCENNSTQMNIENSTLILPKSSISTSENKVKFSDVISRNERNSGENKDNSINELNELLNKDNNKENESDNKDKTNREAINDKFQQKCSAKLDEQQVLSSNTSQMEQSQNQLRALTLQSQSERRENQGHEQNKDLVREYKEYDLSKSLPEDISDTLLKEPGFMTIHYEQKDSKNTMVNSGDTCHSAAKKTDDNRRQVECQVLQTEPKQSQCIVIKSNSFNNYAESVGDNDLSQEPTSELRLVQTRPRLPRDDSDESSTERARMLKHFDSQVSEDISLGDESNLSYQDNRDIDQSFMQDSNYKNPRFDERKLSEQDLKLRKKPHEERTRSLTFPMQANMKMNLINYSCEDDFQNNEINKSHQRSSLSLEDSYVSELETTSSSTGEPPPILLSPSNRIVMDRSERKKKHLSDPSCERRGSSDACMYLSEPHLEDSVPVKNESHERLNRGVVSQASTDSEGKDDHQIDTLAPHHLQIIHNAHIFSPQVILSGHESDGQDSPCPSEYILQRGISRNVSPAPYFVDSDSGERSSTRSPHGPRRYSKRPLRGPYGEMLEAEMSKSKSSSTYLTEDMYLRVRESKSSSPRPGSPGSPAIYLPGTDSNTLKPVFTDPNLHSIDDSSLRLSYGTVDQEIRHKPSSGTTSLPIQSSSYDSDGENSRLQPTGPIHQRTASSPSKFFCEPGFASEEEEELIRYYTIATERMSHRSKSHQPSSSEEKRSQQESSNDQEILPQLLLSQQQLHAQIQRKVQKEQNHDNQEGKMTEVPQEIHQQQDNNKIIASPPIPPEVKDNQLNHQQTELCKEPSIEEKPQTQDQDCRDGGHNEPPQLLGSDHRHSTEHRHSHRRNRVSTIIYFLYM